MQVETYESNEQVVGADGAVEADKLDAESIALIEKLGLEGQRELISKPTDTGTQEMMPYNEMTMQEASVYELLFPIKTRLAEYKSSAIPMRVLQVAALATERDWFIKLEVWHKRTGSIKEDPLLVGIKKNKTGWGIDQRFLLARWGDALKPFSTLAPEAAAIARAKLKTAVATATRELQNIATALEIVSDSQACRWATGSVPTMFNASVPSDSE